MDVPGILYNPLYDPKCTNNKWYHLCFHILAGLTDVFMSDGNAISIFWHFLFAWSLIMISGLLAAISLSLSVGILHKVVDCSCSTTVSGLCLDHLLTVMMS